MCEKLFTPVERTFAGTVSIAVMGNRKIWHVCLLAIVGVALALALCVLYTFSLRKSARRILADVNGVVGSSDPTAALRQFRQTYGRKVMQSDRCTPDDCSYQLEIGNRIPAVGDILPSTRLTARFDVVKGKLSLVMLESRTALKHGISPAVHVQVDICFDGVTCDWFSIDPWKQQSLELTNGSVEFGRATTQDRRRAALALDADCLMRLAGCRTIAELLPTIWQRSSASTVTCVIPNNSGEAYESYRTQ